MDPEKTLCLWWAGISEAGMTVHPQDIANLILYIQVELAVMEQQPELSPDSQARLRRCQEILQRSIDSMGLRPWYQELTEAMQGELGRLEEWF
jgi:hypothetical protein